MYFTAQSCLHTVLNFLRRFNPIIICRICQYRIPPKTKFHRSGQIPLLGSKFHISWKTVVATHYLFICVPCLPLTCEFGRPLTAWSLILLHSVSSLLTRVLTNYYNGTVCCEWWTMLTTEDVHVHRVPRLFFWNTV